MTRPTAMRIGFDEPTVIELKTRPKPCGANFLHILGEFPNRVVPSHYLCERLQTTPLGLRIIACRVRKHLTSDWTVQCHNGGYRLIDMRGR